MAENEMKKEMAQENWAKESEHKKLEMDELEKVTGGKGTTANKTDRDSNFIPIKL